MGEGCGRWQTGASRVPSQQESSGVYCTVLKKETAFFSGKVVTGPVVIRLLAETPQPAVHSSSVMSSSHRLSLTGSSQEPCAKPSSASPSASPGFRRLLLFSGFLLLTRLPAVLTDFSFFLVFFLRLIFLRLPSFAGSFERAPSPGMRPRLLSGLSTFSAEGVICFGLWAYTVFVENICSMQESSVKLDMLEARC
ncbi:hypothetical protein CSUI_005460 [Cystoisospora suis]|uniref:Transmembrane protein n=1 Tax=Cystoisospora suis TaxID=483139 RepID=A0A2C6KJK9_9APIC|nr:hypothetical protein CSUI_005460 [Cystoisospora suis]